MRAFASAEQAAAVRLVGTLVQSPMPNILPAKEHNSKFTDYRQATSAEASGWQFATQSERLASVPGLSHSLLFGLC